MRLSVAPVARKPGKVGNRPVRSGRLNNAVLESGTLWDMKTERVPLPILLLAVSLLAACAETLPTARSNSHTGPWTRGEDRVEDANLAADIHMALLDKLGQDAL